MEMNAKHYELFDGLAERGRRFDEPQTRRWSSPRKSVRKRQSAIGAIRSFIGREHRFLQQPLSVSSRLLLLASVVFLGLAAVLPLWKIHLIAPQYEEGLQLNIHASKLVGGNDGQDLTEINILNHYIGMKPLNEADFVEMKWLPFALGFFALLALRAALVGKVNHAVDLLALFAYFGVFSFGSFYYRMYQYGHELDPTSPMTIEPFTPTVVGTQTIANFIQTSLPMSGGIMLCVFPVCVALAIWFSRRNTIAPTYAFEN